jgi:hypothetical protein
VPSGSHYLMCGLQRATKDVKQRDPRHAAWLCQCAPRADRASLSTIRFAPRDVTCTVHAVGDKLPPRRLWLRVPCHARFHAEMQESSTRTEGDSRHNAGPGTELEPRVTVPEAAGPGLRVVVLCWPLASLPEGAVQCAAYASAQSQAEIMNRRRRRRTGRCGRRPLRVTVETPGARPVVRVRLAVPVSRSAGSAAGKADGRGYDSLTSLCCSTS